MTEGFPTDENGKTVNSRDYEHNKAYRQGVEDKARSYDERAIQEPVVVSQDGYVMSGNDRTMSGQLAAQNGTDTQYVEYLHDHAEKYGFTKEDVDGMQSPRLVFVPDMQFEYTAKEFDAFNKDSRKTEDKMAQTVKLGKIISPKTIAKIAAIIDEKETMGDIYSDKKAVNDIVNILIADGVLNENERAQMFDGEQLSASGKDFVENVLVGAVLNEDSVYIVSEMKNVRQRIVKSVLLILQNKGFGEYSILDKLNDAIKFLYEAKKAGFKDNVTDYMRSQNLFEDNPSDVYPAVVSLFADALNTTERKVKRVFELYNKEAAQASQGQLELFGDGAMTSEEILTEVINTINGKNGRRQKEEGGTPEGADAAESGTTGEQGGGRTEEDGKGKGKSEGKQGVAKPESVLDKAKRIAEEEEARRKAEEAERNRDLTEDEINSSDIDESLKVGALAYLKGNRSIAVTTAYQIVKDYVRNQSRISAADSGNADGSLVGSRADETAGGESRQSGSDGARLDREDVRFRDISRETETFGEGQQIAIEQTEEGLRVDGLGNEYADTFSLLDAWRNKYPNYFTSLSEDGKTLVVTSWDLKPRKQTAAESRRAKAYLKRKTENARRAVTDMAKRLHVVNVEILESTEGLEGKKAKAKGWTDTRTGKIVIVLPNHTSVGDVLSTLLHEGVAHFGLRKLFGKHFDTFLDNVYKNASEEVRKRIAMLAARKKWNIRVATEEYLAMMAEDMNFERAYEQGWWSKIKDVFLKMLAKVGVSVPTLTDNELRYILWRSYDNLKNPGHRSIFSAAEDIATQSGLGVGNYAAPVASADRVADSASEEQQIIDKAKADGTYMKAPNGKKSNLTPKQWAQVRTKAFKEWFGDWEKVLRIEKLRSSNPIEITGDEYKGKYELDRESAKGWIKDNLRDEYRIDDTDELIQLTKVGANKVTSHSMGNDAHLKSIAVIPDIIKNAIFIEERVNEKGNDKFDSYRYYACGLRIGETDYTVKLTIGVKSGRKYYDHALTEIEKGKLLNVISQSGFKAMGDAPVPSSAILKDTKLISILQANSSKVVDENGEPRVVYHGSDWRPILDGDGIFKAFDGAAGKGVYFTSVFSEAADYAREKLDNDELTEDEIDEGHYVTEVFLNITDSDDIYSSDYGTDGLNYLVKNPSQIKSATDNNGEFDSNNPDIRFREADESDISDRDGVLARDFYEKMVSTGMYQVQEALQDSMLGLKKFYEAVYEAQGKKFRMEDVAGFENAYMAENALSSINMAEMNAYRELVFNPILEEVAKIAKTKEERRELEDYMIAKHGLERNVVFARRDAQKAFEKQEKKRKALEKLGLEMKKQKSEENFFNEFRKKDYSGLTDLMEATDVAETEELAAGQHRKVFRIDVADGDELHVGYFHRPSLQLMAAASKVAKNDEVRSGETLFDGCFLGGSEVMRFPQCDAGT